MEQGQDIFQLPCNHPRFIGEVFRSLLKRQEGRFLFQLFDLEREAEASAQFDLSGLQESLRFRALRRSRLLAAYLTEEKGEIKPERLEQVISALESEGHFFYPYAFNESILLEHFIKILKYFRSPDALKSIRRFQLPVSGKWAESLVAETIGGDAPLSDGQVRRAVLISSLTPLRQNVGSCFATAPAILIQRDQYLTFLEDLYQLLSTGKLTRTYGGTVYAVPLSPSAGIGDLKKNLLSSASKKIPWYSPGLLSALEAISPFSEGLSTQQKATLASEWAHELASGKKSLSVEEFLHSLILKKLGTTEEELNAIQRQAQASIRRGQVVFTGGQGFNSQKLDQWQRFQQMQEKARARFNGFCDPPLLKAWEFTLASYSEIKMDFSRWNLYSSLGLSSEEKGGIGEVIYRHVDEKLAQINEKLEQYQREYEIAFDQMRGSEVLLRKASSESEARRLQAEYQSRAYHMRSCLEQRDKIYARGSELSKLHPFLMREYDEKFPEYFQEIYDATMQDFQGELYDDSPAGFRLMFKHGRSDPSTWTLIQNSEQYIEVLVEFFLATESLISSSCDWEGGESEIAEITSAIVHHLRTPAFLESAFQRMAKAHQAPIVQSPLSQIHAIEKKPWAYTSGGVMATLLKTYYRKEGELQQESRWVESESDLLIFLIDTLKNLPPKRSEQFQRDRTAGMLISSPSHAFILLPGEKKFKEGWQEELFTYTWVRDTIFLPNQQFYSGMRLNSSEQRFLIEEFCEHLSPMLSHALQEGFSTTEKNMAIIDWRNRVMTAMQKRKQFAHKGQADAFADSLDSFLYEHLPVVSGRDWKMLVRRLFSDLNSSEIERALAQLPEVPSGYLTAKQVKEMAKACYLMTTSSLFFSFDLSRHIADHSRYIGLAAPAPLLFADTNWTNDFFTFLVNPGTGRLELWRTDSTLSQGQPMSMWKQWLNGADRKPWIVYV